MSLMDPVAPQHNMIILNITLKRGGGIILHSCSHPPVPFVDTFSTVVKMDALAGGRKLKSIGQDP